MAPQILSTLSQFLACIYMPPKQSPETMLIFLSIGPTGTNFSEIWIKIQLFPLKKIHLKMLFSKTLAIFSKPQYVDEILSNHNRLVWIMSYQHYPTMIFTCLNSSVVSHIAHGKILTKAQWKSYKTPISQPLMYRWTMAYLLYMEIY